MREWLTTLLVIISTFFMLLAAIGVVRMPDVFARLQVTTKGATIGAGVVLLSVAVFFSDIPIMTRALLGIAFLALTQPVAAHMIGRAAYIGGVELWSGTVVDDLRAPADLRDDPAAEFTSTTEILESLAADDDEHREGSDEDREGAESV
jgi:multicomponent Na+:H+ antiporter subunit G